MAVPKTGGKRAEQFLSVTATKSSRSTQNWNTRSKKIAPTKNSIANTVRSEKTFKMSTLVFLSLFFDSQCSFNRTPLNAVRRIGEQVTMGCGTSGCSSTDEYCDHPCENLAWVRYLPKSSEMDHILMLNRVSNVFADGISLVDQSSGNCNLKIKIQASSDAGTYKCIHVPTGESASAELVVLEDEPECAVKTNDKSYIVTCSVRFSGNWAPEMTWTSTNEHDSATIKATASDTPNREIRRTVTLPRIRMVEKKLTIKNYKCAVNFTEQGRPEGDGIAAANVPDYKWTMSFGAGK